jgi:anthranilate phosphoribosyltransferase
MDAIDQGRSERVQEAQAGVLAQMPNLPAPDIASTAHWTQEVLNGKAPVPYPIAQQVAHIVRLSEKMRTTT